MKIVTKFVLAFTVTMMLLGCVSVVKVTMFSQVEDNKKFDDTSLEQKYDTDIEDIKRKKGIR